MNNNVLLLLLPFLMNGKAGNMTGILTEILKNNQSAVDPTTLLLLTMLTGKETKNGSDGQTGGAEAVKNVGGEDVANMLKMLLKNRNQSV